MRRGCAGLCHASKESGEFIRHAVKQSAGPGPKYHTAQAPPPPRRGFTFGSERRFYKLPKKFNQFETPGPGRYDGALNRTGDASFTKLTSSPSFGFGSGSYADGPKRCVCAPLRIPGRATGGGDKSSPRVAGAAQIHHDGARVRAARDIFTGPHLQRVRYGCAQVRLGRGV
jgi:hypothetical protein